MTAPSNVIDLTGDDVVRNAQRPYLYFKSNGKKEYRLLSNFAPTPVIVVRSNMPTYDSLISENIDRAKLPAELHFPSNEHACQALKADDWSTFAMFLTGGRLAALTAENFVWLTTKTEWKKKTSEEYATAKVKYYSSAGLTMVGVVAKFAGSMKRAKRLGYALRNDREFLEESVEADLWQELLLAKFTQNEAAKRVLLGSGDLRIVEHDKGARQYHSHWGGLVNEDGSITGANKMGLFLERVRGILQRGVKRKLEPDVEDNPVPEPVKKKARRIPTEVIKVTGTDTVMIIDDGFAQVPYEPAFFTADEATGFFETLLRETAWTEEVIKRWGKEITTPRRVFAFSDPDVVYRYIQLSRVGAPWTPTMQAIKERVEAYCGTKFNFCFVNLYRDGEDTIGEHSDDEKALIKGHQIASVSFSPDGGDRDLLFVDKARTKRLSICLAHGSLYVMKGETQKRYKHEVPRRPKVTKPRINLTFRQIRVAEKLQ